MYKFSPDGTLLAIATEIGILFYRTKTYDNPEILKGHTRKIWSIAFSPDGNTIASIDPNYIHLWDTDTGQYHRRLNKGKYPFPGTDLAFSPDGNTIAGVGGDAAVWDVKEEELIRVLISKR